MARLARPGLAWPGLAWPGPGRRRCGLGHNAICRESTSFCYAKIDLGAPRLAWPGLAWPGLAPGKVALVPGFWRHSWELALENAAVSQVLAESAREGRRSTVAEATAPFAGKAHRFATRKEALARLAWPGLAWPGLPGPGLACLLGKWRWLPGSGAILGSWPLKMPLFPRF